MWVRGLKLSPTDDIMPFRPVAPRVGAWIETYHLGVWIDDYKVAPRVGAWIETNRLNVLP